MASEHDAELNDADERGADESADAGAPDDLDEMDEPPVDLRPKKPRDETEMDITPMIDVTFLLLIFFLVASKMDEAGGAKLPPAAHGIPVASKEAIILIVGEGTEDEAAISTGHGEELAGGDPEAQEERIMEYVENGLAGLSPFSGPKHEVLIKADKNVKHREVARVAKAVGRAADAAELPNLNVAILEQE